MSEKPFDLLPFVDAISYGVFGVDGNGLCLFVNAAALRILGYDRAEDLVGRNMHDLIHHTRVDGSHYPEEECPLLNVAHGGRQVRLENEPLWRRDGSSFLAEYSAFPVERDGSVIGSVITFAENGVRQDARIRLSVQHAVSQVLASTLGRDALMTKILATIGAGFKWDVGLFWRRDEAPLHLAAHWSTQASLDPGAVVQAAFGEHPERTIGLAARAYSEGRAVDWSPGIMIDDPLIAQATQHGMRSGFAFPVQAGSEVFGAMEFFSRDVIETDATLLEAVAVLGQMIGQALERQQLTYTMRKSEARFRVIANTIPQLAWMTNAKGEISWFNDRWYAYTGTTPEQMQGWGWMATHHPEHIDRVERTFRRSFAVGGSWEDTFPLRGADGTYRWFLSRAEPIRAALGDNEIEGNFIGWFGTNTDITTLRAAEQSQADALDESEAASQAKSLFLANMSHELRTPLSAIIGYSELMIEEVEDGAEPADLVLDIRKVETNARHLLGLINDVLDLSKVESGKMEAFAETFDVAEMVRAVAATVSSLVERKRNRLEVEIADGVASAHSDITRIRQVLLNLLSNAAKFTEDGLITLSAAPDLGPEGSAWLRFSVRDSGLGMTAEQVAKLFQRFQQADASTTRNFGGTGLGLSLARAFSELLGGRIEVTSEPGRGSLFTMMIPATLSVTTEATPPEAFDAAEGRQVVLVIDDDPTHRELMSRFLDRSGYAARVAGDGPTGLAMAREHAPHAILLDVTMPGMDGWSVLSTLKADPALADIPVVMVTLVDQKALASSLGAADYINKPVDWARLGLMLDRFRPADGDVLVIDDDEETRRRLRYALERNGWSVNEARDGLDGLEKIRVALPRLILLDLSMPVMDGFEFLRQLREEPGCGTIPVIVLSALSLSLDDRRRLRGASQVLNKGSISLNELTEKLRNIENLASR